MIESPQVVVNLESITLHDNNMRPVGTQSKWLESDDPLDQATREFLTARREASQASIPRPGITPWVAAANAKTRTLANDRAVQAKNRARCLLAERGVLAQAQRLGLKFIGLL